MYQEGVVLPVILAGLGEAVVVKTVEILDAGDSGTVTFFTVDVCHLVVAEVKADGGVVEGLTW